MNQFFHDELKLDGFLNLTFLNFYISPKKVRDFARKFSNNTATLRDIFEIDSNNNSNLNHSVNFEFLSKITNLSTPISSMLSPKVIAVIKNSLDDAIYFSETYTEFFKMLNISPNHWRSLFILFKNDFENTTISRCFALIGLDIGIFINKISLIFNSLNKETANNKITIESLHQELELKPSNSYIELATNLKELLNESKTITPQYLSNLIISTSVYIQSLTIFNNNFFNSMISSSFTYILNIFDFSEFPLKERLILFRSGIEKLRQAPDDSLFKRLILEKIAFLNELSYYTQNFLNNDFNMRHFIVDFLKINDQKYTQKVQSIYNFLNNTSVIDEVNKNSPIGQFLNDFVYNTTALQKDASLQILFHDKESFRKALDRIVNFSNESYEIPLFVSIQKSLELIMKKESTFEREFSFDASKINEVMKNIKESNLRQFLTNYGYSEIADKLNDFGSFLKYLSKLQKKFLTKNNLPLFDRIDHIGDLLQNENTDARSLLDAVDNGFSIVIDVLFNFTRSILDKKEPSEVIRSISPRFLNCEETVNNLINFAKAKPLSLKNFNDAIVIEIESKPKPDHFTFYDLIPTDKALHILNELSSIVRAKNDLTIGDLWGKLNITNDFFNGALNFMKKTLLTPIIDIIKKLCKRYFVSDLDVDSTVLNLREFVKSILDDKTIGIPMFDSIFVKIPPTPDLRRRKVLAIILPVIGCAILTIFLLVLIVLKVTKSANQDEESVRLDSDDCDYQKFKDNDLLLQTNNSINLVS